MAKRRKRRKRKNLLGVVLLILAMLCIAGIVLLTGRIIQKEKDASRAAKELAASAGEEISDTGEAADESTAADMSEKSDAENAGNAKESAGEGEATEQESAPDAEKESEEEAAAAAASPKPETVTVGDVTFHGGFTAAADENTVVPSDTDVLSANSILIDLSTDRIVAQKDADVRIYPASMTKILTVLVAAEHVTDLDDTFTMTSDITGYCLTQGCSAAGFVGGEAVPVRDLFYGTILPSGGEAAVGLATYVAGSQEAFVELMNEKLKELGLSDTAHVTNCVGIYDDNHYCTAYDMAMILKAAVENDFCREVLSAHVYYTTVTEQNPEGLILSNWFLRRIEDKDCGGTVLCAKTGFVTQSGDCAASYEISNGGTPYICVTVNTYSSWRCIYDHVAMYQLYAA